MTFKIHSISFLLSTTVPVMGLAQSSSPVAIPAAASASQTAADTKQGAGIESNLSGPSGSVANASPEPRPLLPEPNLFELGLFGGAFFPSSNHNLQSESKPHLPYGKAAPELGLRLAYFPWAFLGAEFEAAAIPAKVKDGGGAGLWAARAHVIGQLTSSRITPFLLLGCGAIGATSKEMGSETNGAFHFGIGAKAALDETLSIRVDLRDSIAEKYSGTSGLAHHPELLLGMTMTMDRSKPEPPPPPPPPDSDRDGFADIEDACPEVAGVAPKGCPADTDSDGLADGVDQCPAMAGPAPTGCPPPPDSDKDGVLDATDECPSVAGDMANGCPDLDPDKDGVPVEMDKCPKEAETTNGFQDDDGCPDEIPEAVKRFTGVIKGIEFNFGQATIRADSRALLDKAVETLVAYPDVRMKITGHTDDVGPRERNIDLSQRRADEVKKYFVSKGIDAARITTHGAGPDQPLDSTNTAAARQKNRRIEFSIVNK